MSHPLASLIEAAAAGSFPPVDGGWHRVPVWREGLEAVVAFTGHAVLALAPDISEERLVGLGVDGLGGAHDPRLVVDIAGDGGWIDSLDILLVAEGTGWAGVEPRLALRPDLASHPRVQLAAELRDDVTIFGYADLGQSTVAIVSRGFAGLPELSFEVEPGRRGGAGSTLVREALRTIQAGQLVVAACAPGNAASLRALLSAGFTPVASLQLFRRAPV
jgi:hypothetical protein